MLTINKGVFKVSYIVTALVMAGTGMAQEEAPHRVKVVLVSEKSSVHSSMSNLDVYLLHVSPRKGSAFDAIAVDSYPGYAAALPMRRLRPSSTSQSSSCAVPYCDQPTDTSMLRCITMEHGSWALPKGASPEETWWEVAVLDPHAQGKSAGP